MQTIIQQELEKLAKILQENFILQISERYANDCIHINRKEMIKMAKKSQTVKLKNYTRKLKSLKLQFILILKAF